MTTSNPYSPPITDAAGGVASAGDRELAFDDFEIEQIAGLGRSMCVVGIANYIFGGLILMLMLAIGKVTTTLLGRYASFGGGARPGLATAPNSSAMTIGFVVMGVVMLALTVASGRWLLGGGNALRRADSPQQLERGVSKLHAWFLFCVISIGVVVTLAVLGGVLQAAR